MSLKFLADQCVSSSIIRALRDEGHEVLRLKDLMPPDSEDPAVTAKAQDIDALVTPGDLKLAEGQKVRLVVEPIEKQDEILSLAGRVYEGFTEEQIDSIEQHIRRRDDFFGERTPA